MNIKEAIELLKIKMSEHELDRKGWVPIITRAQTQYGICKYRRKQIGLSSKLIPHCKDEQVMNTITHEIAHALVGAGHHHDAVWQRKHIELGGNGMRTTCFASAFTNMEKGVAKAKIRKRYKYKGVCPNGHTFFRIRKPVKGTCSVCSNKYDERFLITFSLITK